MTAAATPRITPLSVAVVAAFIWVFVGNVCVVGSEVDVVCLEEGEVIVEMKGVLLRERQVCMAEMVCEIKRKGEILSESTSDL